MRRLLGKTFTAVMMAVALYVIVPQAHATAPAAPVAATEADAAAAQGYMNTIINQPYDANDLAHKSLVRLFGGFIFKPFGGAPADAPTVLAKVLGYTNVIAMILGVIIMAYVLVAGALNTAASGEMLGRSWSSVWLPLRTSLAFGMIVPATNGGEVFSVAQSLVIWMIIVGSNSATWLWQQGAASLVSGDPVMPKVTFHVAGAAKPMINMISCSVVRSKLMEKREGTAPEIGYVNKVVKTGTFFDTNEHIPLTIANLGTVSLDKASSIELTDCGSIGIPSAGDGMEGTAYDNIQTGTNFFVGKSSAWEDAVQAGFNASVKKNFNTFLVSAKQVGIGMYDADLNGKKIESAKSTGGTEYAAVKKLLDAAAVDFGTALVAYETYISTVEKETIASAATAGWGSEMTKGGWMRAGAWFFETSRLQGFIQTILGSLNASSLSSPDPSDGCFVTGLFTNCKDQKEEYKSWLLAIDTIDGEATSKKTTVAASNNKGAMHLVNSEDGVKAMDDKAIDSVSAAASSLFMDTIMGWGEDDAKGLAGNVGGNQSKNVTGMISPFTAVTSLGRGLQQIGVTVWTGGLIVSGFLEMKSNPLGTIADTLSLGRLSFLVGMSKYIISSLAPVLAGVGGLAFMLAFAIPFMPVTIWIMLVCGYLVTVIEAIAAAPLAVIMLATPEGEGISGQSFNKALQMINAIVLRPSLSIVGLFAAMTLSYAGFAIMNELFWSVAGLTTNVSVFEILAMIFIYATLAFKLCEYMVSIIHKIPDQIMDWMGGGMSREFGESAAGQNMTDAVKTNTAASGISGMAGMKTAGGIAKGKMDAKRAQEGANRDTTRHDELMGAIKRS